MHQSTHSRTLYQRHLPQRTITMSSTRKTTVKIIALATTSEPVQIPQGWSLVRVKAPVMGVATSMTIEGSVDEGATFDTLYVAGTGVTVSATIGGTARSFQFDPNFTKGLDQIRIKTNGSETVDKNFEVVLSS